LFSLRAYLLVVFGDIPAISLLLRMKGHNGYSPCRMCYITGVRSSDPKSKVLYVPLDRASHPSVQNDNSAIKCYNSAALPLRTHDEFIQQATEVQSTRTNVEAERLAKEYGVKGLPILAHLPSLSLPRCAPYDIMHLIFENLLPNLVKHWTGEFKGLDEGREDYQFEAKVWEALGRDTAATGKTMPSAYGARVPNIEKDRGNMSAEMWSIWMLYIGPVLLERRFTKRKYYDH
ncbi:hypothetical protein GGF50DRAFT_37758, partial [Schizophyllum commune]